MIRFVAVTFVALLIIGCSASNAPPPGLLVAPQTIGTWCDSRGVVGVEDSVLEIREGGPTGFEKVFHFWAEDKPHALDASPLRREEDTFHTTQLIKESYEVLQSGDLKITGYRYSDPDTPIVGTLTKVEGVEFPTTCRQAMMDEINAVPTD